MTSRDSGRGETELTIFGRHPVRDALRSDGAEVLEVRCVRTLPAEDRSILRGLAEPHGLVVEEVSREALARATGAERHDQGIAARIRLRRVAPLESFLESTTGRAARVPRRILALDGVTNSQNVGMIVRSVVGAGFDGLLWPERGQPWVNGLVVRAAAGSIFECPILLCDDIVAGLGQLQGAGFELTGLAAEAEESLFAKAPEHRAVFVLGSESTGLSETVASLLDRAVSIPMAGPLESLNVAVAAGLVCFHAAGLTAATPA